MTIKNGSVAVAWSRQPDCPWIVQAQDGTLRCSYQRLKPDSKALDLARYTMFEQSFVAEATERLRTRVAPGGCAHCAPSTCPSWLARLTNKVFVRLGSS